MATVCAAGRVLAAEKAPPLKTAELHEADYYEQMDENRVRCLLCPWLCVVPDGQRGRCRIRENRDGRFYSIVYGRPCVTNVDPIEKKPFFHVKPGTQAYSLATAGCSFSCKFCQNNDISQAKPEDVKTSIMSPADVAAAATARKCNSVAYTYSEPSVFPEYVIDCAKAARDAGLANVVVSNGFINEKPLKDMCSVLSAIKIDLKAFTQKFYEEVCYGQLQPVLDTLKRVKGSGVWFEIVVLVIPTLNDNKDNIRKMSAWVAKELGPDVPLHFTSFHPDYKLQNLPATPEKTLVSARDIAMAEGCNFVYIGNLPGSAGANTYCPKCKTTVIERYGYSVKSLLDGGSCPKCKTVIPGLWK